MPRHPYQDVIDRLGPDARELFEERAAIHEYEAGLPREVAESLALLTALMREPSALTGVSVMAIEIEGKERCALVTDRTALRLRLICKVHRDLEAVLSEQFDGAALLSPLTPNNTTGAT
jgi:hypothetical protein